MRVAVVAESFPPAVNGVARSTGRVVDHLVARGHQAVVVTTGAGPDRHGDVEVLRLPCVALPMCRDFPVGLPTPALREALVDVAPDVVHLASPITLGARGVALARRLSLPSVAVFQTDVAGFARSYHGTVLAPAIWRWLAHVHGQADRTLAPSRPLVDALQRHGVPRVHRWGRGVDLAAFSPVWRTRPPTAAVRRVRVGFVGRLAAEKRVERLRVLAGLRGVDLVVVGDGPRRQRLQRALPQAVFTGMLRGPALSRAYADLDVFVHTGTHETFCQAAQEALASGVPAVVPAAGGPLDLVTHGHDGLLWPPGDPGAMRDAVAALSSDPLRRAVLGRHARAGVLGRSWEAVGDALIGHYDAVRDDGRRLATAA